MKGVHIPTPPSCYLLRLQQAVYQDVYLGLVLFLHVGLHPVLHSHVVVQSQMTVEILQTAAIIGIRNPIYLAQPLLLQ